MLSIKAKLYFKVFCYFGCSFAVIMSVIDWISGDGFSIWKFLFSAVFFGLFMSIFLVSLLLNNLKSLGIKELNEDIIKVKQETKVKPLINQSCLLKRLKADLIFKNYRITEEKNKIRIKTKAGWESWGEIIEIIFPDKDKDDIIINSKPRFRFTLLDYGKNYENVKYIEQLINQK